MKNRLIALVALITALAIVGTFYFGILFVLIKTIKLIWMM